MDVRVGLWRKLSAEELMLLNCGVGEDSWKSLGLKEIQPVYPKEISPEFSLEGLMLRLKLQYFGHLKRRTDSFEKTLMLGKIEAGGEGDDRGRDGWMASPTWWMWVWVNSRSWWWTGKPGMLQSLGSQRVGLDWAIELNWDILDLWQYWVTPAEWDIPSGGQSILLNLVSLLHFPTGFKSKVRTLTLEVMR